MPDTLRIEERWLWYLWSPVRWLLSLLPTWVTYALFTWLLISACIVEGDLLLDRLPAWVDVVLALPYAVLFVYGIVPVFITKCITVLLWPWRKLS